MAVLAASLGVARPFSSTVRPSTRRRPWQTGVVSSQGAPEDGPSTSGGSGDAGATPPHKQVPYRAIGALAAVGLAETTYLTAAKLAHVDVACPLSGGCAEILTSEYSNLLGVIPLSVLGMLAYGGVALLCLSGWRAMAAHRDATEASLRTAVLAAGISMASCSSYLMWVMLTHFQGEICPWCVGSAALSFSIAGLAASGLQRRELEEAAAPGLGLVATCLLALSLTLGTPDSASAGRAVTELPYNKPVITSTSSGRAVALAERLRDAGAHMYGAFWCSHCYQQKETFGAQAMEAFPYVECFPNGWRSGEPMAEACANAPIKLEGFPTWVIGDQKLVGEQTFDELEAALAKLSLAAPAPVAAAAELAAP